MAGDRWFDILENTLESAGFLKYHPPITFHSGITVLPFGPYDAGNGTWKFRTALRFETTETNTSVRGLHALTSGTITYRAGLNQGPGKVILTRGDVTGAALASANGALPMWYPKTKFIVYEHVDPGEAEKAAKKLFEESKEKDSKGKEKIVPPLNTVKSVNALEQAYATKKNKEAPKKKVGSSVNELVKLWLDGKLNVGLTVTEGRIIGACAKDDNAAPGAPPYFAEVRMVESIDPPPKLFYNPSYFLALWEEKGWMKDKIYPGMDKIHPELIDTSAPPAGTGKLRFVKGGGTGQITAAISTADAGDTILILDNETYFDGIVIDSKPISLTSTAPTTNLSKYPTLDGNMINRPITIRNINSGIAHVGKLFIQNGSGLGSRSDGGGILVEKANNVIISSCMIRLCEAQGTGAFGEGFGGGIAAYHSSPGILNCTIEKNNAWGRGQGIGVFGYGWPTIYKCTIQDNGKSTKVMSDQRRDGGGIGIEIAVPNIENRDKLAQTLKTELKTQWDPVKLKNGNKNYVRIMYSKISKNIANDDGGGIYISVMSGVLMRMTTVSNNKATNNGGGIRVTMASTLQMSKCSINDNFSNNAPNDTHQALDEKGPGGGGLSARNAGLIELKETKIENNIAFGWAGGGISFITTDEGPCSRLPYIPHRHYHTDFNDVLWDIFKYTRATLHIDGKCSFKGNKATQLPKQGDHGKGGALYVLRSVGERCSDLDVPPEHALNGLLLAMPVNITVTNTSVLDSSNNGSFPHSSRLYLDDKTTSKAVDADDDFLKAAEDKKNMYFSYP